MPIKQHMQRILMHPSVAHCDCFSCCVLSTRMDVCAQIEGEDVNDLKELKANHTCSFGTFWFLVNGTIA